MSKFGRRAVELSTLNLEATLSETSRGYRARNRPVATPKKLPRFVPPTPSAVAPPPSSSDSSSQGGSPRKKRRTLPTELGSPLRQHSPSRNDLSLVDPHDNASDTNEDLPPNISPPTFVTQGGTKKTYSQHDFMRDWLPYKHIFLDAILDREARQKTTCTYCGVSDGTWRCLDCLTQDGSCKSCFRDKHSMLPLHRIERWSGDHYTPSWLWQTDLQVFLGHGGKSCPNIGRYEQGQADVFTEEVDVEEEWMDVESDEDRIDDADFSYGAKPPSRVFNGAKAVVVIHNNGIHHLPFVVCSCPNAKSEVQQFLEMGYYPASVKSVHTVATFALLDDYHMDQVECHTSSYHYFAKLRRITNKAYPQTVENRYRELGRMGRQWVHLKNLRWFGFGHTSQKPDKGGLALFCAACPQKGINVSEAEWEDLPDTLKLRSFVADGNFSCVHQKQRASDEDAWITSGTGYVTEKDDYAKHIQKTSEAKEKSTCNQHRAIADKWRSLKGCDVTGIGSIACMRHGCFVPGSTVDFQKGERQMNMDYAFCEALGLSNLEGVPWALLAYDINCQYSVHFLKRVRKSKTLRKFPRTLTIMNAIGLWHVHGHKPECYARFAPSFIPGAGRRSGEILESLWDTINRVAGAMRTMSSSHRAEALDAIMSDSNWKKLINLVAYIVKELPNAFEGSRKALLAFEALSKSVTDEQRKRWSDEISNAHVNRLSRVDAMDVMNSKIDKAPPRATVEVNLMDLEQSSGEDIGVTQWLSSGITIQEKQCQILSAPKRLGKDLTPKQRLAIAKDREDLLASIQRFYADAERLFPGANLSDLRMRLPPGPKAIPEGSDADAGDDYVSEEDDDDTAEGESSESDELPEQMCIPLPSMVESWPQNLKSAVEKERRLRVSQADNELEEIRDSIGRLSYLYRSLVRKSKTKKSKTRAFSIVKGSRDDIKFHVHLYRQAKFALLHLETPARVLERFRDITTDDLKINTAIADPNARGQSSEKLSWIWGSSTGLSANRTVYLEELYRVNWIRTRETYLRWEEEYQLLFQETNWVPAFFDYQAQRWEERKETSTRAGHLAYCCRQSAMWRSLASYARTEFAKALKAIRDSLEDSSSNAGSASDSLDSSSTPGSLSDSSDEGSL